MKEQIKNSMCASFDARSVNESLARMMVAAFLAELNPTLEELADVKTAVSEAVTNAIVHGYGIEIDNEQRMDEQEESFPKVELRCSINGGWIYIEIEDQGVGIENVREAMQPLFTTKPTLERTGMGFSFMEAFMDEVSVESKPGVGTKVTLKKNLNEEETKADTCECP